MLELFFQSHNAVLYSSIALLISFFFLRYACKKLFKLYLIIRDMIADKYIYSKEDIDDYKFDDKNNFQQRYREEKEKIIQKSIEQKIENQKAFEQMGLNMNRQQDDYDRIIGITKPLGKWTEMIIKEKMGYLIAFKDMLTGKKDGDNKPRFWQTLIRAQSNQQGKYKGKGPSSFK